MLRKNNLDDERFSDLMERARLQTPKILPAWSDLNTHDPGVMLMELLAWLTEMQRFHMDQSEDAAAFFPLLGITPHQVRPARVSAVLPEGTRTQIPAGTPAMAESIRFETIEEIPACPGKPITIQMEQRHTMYENEPCVLGNANGFPHQQMSVDTGGQRIMRDGFSLLISADGRPSSAERWDYTDDFRASGPDDPHFTLDSETGVIRFGDGIHGRMPKGVVLISAMRLTWGAAGNITSGQLKELCLNGIRLPLEQPLPAEGGAERESTSETMARLVSENRQAVTAEDICTLVMETPDVELEAAVAFAMKKIQAPGKPRAITITGKPFGDRAELTTAQKHAIRSHLEPYRLAGYEFEVVSAYYVPLQLNLELCASRQDAGFVKRLEEQVRDYCCGAFGGFRTRISGADIAAFISKVPEITQILICELRTYSQRVRTDTRRDILPDPGVIVYLDSLRIKVT